MLQFARMKGILKSHFTLGGTSNAGFKGNKNRTKPLGSIRR